MKNLARLFQKLTKAASPSESDEQKKTFCAQSVHIIQLYKTVRILQKTAQKCRKLKRCNFITDTFKRTITTVPFIELRFW